VVDQHDVDCLWRLGDVEDRVSRPIDAGDLGTVEGDLLRQCAARALDDIAFDAAPQPIGVDDQPAIMRHGEFARPDFAATAFDLDLEDDRHDGRRALGIGNAAAGQSVAVVVGVWRWPRLPPGALGPP
jgi:hypothetical protein